MRPWYDPFALSRSVDTEKPFEMKAIRIYGIKKNIQYMQIVFLATFLKILKHSYSRPAVYN